MSCTPHRRLRALWYNRPPRVQKQLPAPAAASDEHYWQMAHGSGDHRAVPDRDAKSISDGTTFAADIAGQEMLRVWLVGLVEGVARRLREHDIKGRTVELKVRFADFRTITRSLT